MKSFYFLFFILFILTAAANAQVDTIKKPSQDTINRDSVSTRKDSISPKRDSIVKRVVKPVIQDTIIIKDSLPIIEDSLPTSITDSIPKKTIVDSLIKSETKISSRKTFTGKELLFYYLVFLFLLFGLLREAFPKYFFDLFRVFFRTTLKQKQVREQLLQSALPSILMNGFFVLTAGMYINFLLVYFRFSVSGNFRLQYLYCVLSLCCIYLVKFIGLKISGWLFNIKGATESYIFIVFIVNKILGILLLPFLVLLAFTTGNFYQAVIVLSWIGVGLLYCYRFFLTYGTVRNEIKLNPFHFILYLAAFELIPLLLIYKMLLIII
jgi:uncharacterized protein DUF4271